MMMMWHAMYPQGVIASCQNHYMNFNKITFINWLKMFIMPK